MAKVLVLHYSTYGHIETMAEAVAAANRIENDNPIPLAYFFRSYAAQGKKPPEIAVQGLMKALQLAPYDTGNRLTLAEHFIRTGDRPNAEEILAPLINHPHDTGLADLARKLLDAGKDQATQAKTAATTS